MSYAVIYGTDVSTFHTRRNAITVFRAVAARHSNAQIFAVSDGGRFTNLTHMTLKVQQAQCR